MSADGAAGVPASAPTRTPLLRRRWLVTLVAVAVAVTGMAVIAMPNRSESTDNAYLQADSSVVAPKVRGLVAAVLVEHNQRVHKGDPLVRIDPEEFDAKVASASAAFRDAEAGVAAARAPRV